MAVEIDDSFKKPGSVPFKWEIRPGVPKIQQQLQQKQQKERAITPDIAITIATFQSPRSERWRFEQPTHVRPECVSPGCFPSPLSRRKDSKRRTSTSTAKPASEPDYTSDLDTLSRWSISSRKSLSSFRDSPASSFSSYQSSPRPVSDAEWAGFGLF
ncbi:SERINE/ARGININE REPETITIVE MATRIX PROTEIN 1 [Salix purpurea]|uniref:SERINE/ARGININE REPETITIVE MATRIX PROTEIN 1 n=1 Tax=Salix purpurea TaxID=77065 RepID=A0A9Q0WXA0_SALPP|nr:SERINE/ARGININE REPETITIVE MATRIX PROTEIN 1 [Salix purpurea]